MNGTSVQGDRFLLILRAGFWNVSSYTKVSRSYCFGFHSHLVQSTSKRWSQRVWCQVNCIPKRVDVKLDFSAPQNHTCWKTGGHTKANSWSDLRPWLATMLKELSYSEVSSALIIILKSEGCRKGQIMCKSESSSQPSGEQFIERKGNVINRKERR